MIANRITPACPYILPSARRRSGMVARQVRRSVVMSNLQIRLLPMDSDRTPLGKGKDVLHGAARAAPLRQSVEQPCLFVLGDKTQLQQVVFNLVRNAVEAMQESEQRELLLATASSGNNMVEVSIADTGPGIDEEIRSQLFEPFVTTKRNGMGIGLSLCRTIIEAHGGQLWAEPSPNGGTVFRFTLPAISDVE